MSAPVGYIYALVNQSLEGILKIGVSTKHPQERARELSAPSGLPTPFHVAYQRHVANPFEVEAALHRRFDRFRVNDKREFFRISLTAAMLAMQNYPTVPTRMCADFPTPFAELFATFPDDGSSRALTNLEREECRLLAHREGIRL